MLRYRETGELHKDFHGSMNAAVEYVGSRYGLDGLRAVFRATAQRFYRSIYEGLTPSELFCDQTVLLNEAWCQGTPFEAVSEQQEMHCLELFKAQGLGRDEGVLEPYRG